MIDWHQFWGDFHKLWGNAKNSPDYDKQLWIKVQIELQSVQKNCSKSN